MHIDPADDIAGVPILQVRDLLRRAHGGWFNLADVCRRLAVGEAHARTLVDALVQRGLVEVVDLGEGEWWGATIGGNALAMASAAAPVKRATAQRHLDGFLTRVEEANADPELLHWCTRAWLFGSMLDAARDRVNDVDLALRLVRRQPEAYDAASREFATAQQAQGRRFANFIEFAYAPELEFKRRLRAGSRLLSLHNADSDKGFDPATSRLLYTYEPPL